VERSDTFRAKGGASEATRDSSSIGIGAERIGERVGVEQRRRRPGERRHHQYQQQQTMNPYPRKTLLGAAALALLLAAQTNAGLAQAQTNVSGSNNVGLGPVSGGTINIIGFSTEQVAALLKTQGKQRDELLRKIVVDLNQQAQRTAYTEASVRQLIETLTRRQVPPSEWQCALAALSAQQSESKVQHAAGHRETTSPLVPNWELPTQTVTNTVRLLDAFVRLGDPAWHLQLEPYVSTQWRTSDPAPFNWQNTALRIQIGGENRFQITVQTTKPGYFYLVNASNDRNDIALKYPLRSDLQAGEVPYLQANVPFTIPRRWAADGNKGKPEQSTLFAIVAERRIPDLEALLASGSQVADGILGQQLAQAALPCKPSAENGCNCMQSPRKMLDDGEGPGVIRVRYGVARVLLDEY
jgi:hypothetical protein